MACSRTAGALVLAIVAISCAIAFSPLGRALTHHLPLWTLIAAQSFRFPLELAMHTMAERGVMPEQMTYTGSNFDILTGLTAIAVAAALRSGIGGRRARRGPAAEKGDQKAGVREGSGQARRAKKIDRGSVLK